MKKTVSILALSAILLSLTACNGDSGTGSSLPNVSVPQTDSSSKNSSVSSVENSSSAADSSSADSQISSATGTDNSSQESSDTTSSDNNSSSGNNDHEGEMSGSGVFVLDDGRALELYGGGYSRGQNYAETISQLKKMVGRVNVFSLVAPKAVSFYLPAKYSHLTASERDNIDYLNGFLDDVFPVDAYTALSKHVNEDIYFRTDHHWQPLGAYYAAEEFAKVAQVPFAPLSAYETVALEGYVGTMYGWSNENPEVKKHPDVFTYYKPKNNYTVTYYSQSLTDPFEGSLFLRSLDTVPTVSWYLVFMGGDDKVAHIHTDVTNGRKLVMVKDSYGNAFVPCLTNSFEDIWVVDMRDFEGSISQLVKDEGLTDVLFCMCSMSATGDNQYKLADKL